MQGSEGVGPLPLAGVKVLDFSQFLAGPVCALRLQDLGAEVIKIERAGQGDLCRSLVVADQTVGPDSLLFHTINRGKRSVAVDLKSPADLATVRRLIASADVMIHNFRPGVMERIGLGYEAVEAINPRIVYGCVSGYGPDGVWRDQPGQDLLAQSRSGLVWLNGSAGDGPVPIGVSITDIAAGMHLAQGVLAALFKQARTNRGSLVEVSLLASAHGSAVRAVHRVPERRTRPACPGRGQRRQCLRVRALRSLQDLGRAPRDRDDADRGARRLSGAGSPSRLRGSLSKLRRPRADQRNSARGRRDSDRRPTGCHGWRRAASGARRFSTGRNSSEPAFWTNSA